MPVPSGDIVCRFISPMHWSARENGPREGAFKQANLSVWHQDRLRRRNAALGDLLIENLAGYGQAHHQAGDYTELAREVSDKSGVPFQVRIEWRPNDECVEPPWRQWRYAHVQVETVVGPDQFLRRFRKLLTVSSRLVIPPDLQAASARAN